VFEQQMQDSDIGRLSQVFESQHGFHFLEVTGRRIEDFSERFKESQAENYLRNQKFDEELENWIRELREDAFVEIRET
jgi:peptidyl-prolyl cis-trans isomerase SurA